MLLFSPQILRADDHVSITANGRIVQIKHAQVSDTGRYTCVATNIAGEDEKDFDVNIQGELGWLLSKLSLFVILMGSEYFHAVDYVFHGMLLELHDDSVGHPLPFFSLYSVPPNFSRPDGVADTTSSSGFGGDVRDVILNNPISLYCETNAVPPPTLTWYKDGQVLTSNDKVLVLPGNTCKKSIKKRKRQCFLLTFHTFILRWASVTDSQSPGWWLGQVHLYCCQRSRRGLHPVWCAGVMWVKSLVLVV